MAEALRHFSSLLGFLANVTRRKVFFSLFLSIENVFRQEKKMLVRKAKKVFRFSPELRNVENVKSYI